MKKISETQICEFTFDSEEERRQFVEDMESQGWEYTGQIKQFTGNLLLDSLDDSKYVWYAKFYKTSIKC